MTELRTPQGRKQDGADLVWLIIKAAAIRTADRQRWTARRIGFNAALLAAVVVVSFLSGRLSTVSDKAEFAVVVGVAAAALFFLEFLGQTYVATYRAGQAASGETAKLKELYRRGRRYKDEIATIPTTVLAAWAKEVADELDAAIPSERFGFETSADHLKPLGGGWSLPEHRLEALQVQLTKLRAILMRADRAVDDKP